MNLNFFNQIQKHLNTERLDAYRKDHADEATTMARYLLNMALCESLYSPLQMAEITLRNALHESLTLRAGTEEWYDTITLPHWQQEQITNSKSRLQHQQKSITPGKIVAEQTFGFWVAFFTKEHMTSGLAYHIAKTVFVRAPKRERDINKLSTKWQQVRILRNRVFHHERILHWNDLEGQHNNILTLIGWMNPQLQDLTNMLDRFTTIRSGGLSPWRNQLSQQWPIV